MMFKSHAVKFTLAFGTALLFSFSGSTKAATIIGGSDLLSVAYATQMESWLGNDPTLSYSSSLAFTNIFDKGALDDSVSFHAAVYLKGPTFFVAEAKTRYSDDAYSIIGGFNPASWNDSDSTYISSPLATEAGRTAFIFNLTTGDRRDQSLTSQGLNQTLGTSGYGPAFGAGYDIFVAHDLNSGFMNQYTYCPDINTSCYLANILNLLGHDIAGSDPNGLNNYELTEFGRMEVFTISDAPAVPLPAALPLFAAGLSAMGFMGWRKRRMAIPAS